MRFLFAAMLLSLLSFAGTQLARAEVSSSSTKILRGGWYPWDPKPYRRETDVLVLRKGTRSRHSFQNVDEMLAGFAARHFRLGVIAGYTYASEKMI
jgi:hypothetical protein